MGAGVWGGGLKDALDLPTTRAHLLSYFPDLLDTVQVVVREWGGVLRRWWCEVRVES